MKTKGGSERFTNFASRISRRPCGGLARRTSGWFDLKFISWNV